MGTIQGNNYKMQNTRDRNIQDNTKKLCRACVAGDIEVVENVLSNEEVDINGIDGDGTKSMGAPLNYAAIRGYLDIVKRLLLYPGIQIGKRDRQYPHNTALHLACIKNHVS